MSMTKTKSVDGHSMKISSEEIRIGVYVCQCGLNIAQSVDCEGIAEKAASLPGVCISKGISYACSEPGQKEIRTAVLVLREEIHGYSIRNMRNTQLVKIFLEAPFERRRLARVI